MVMRKFIFAVAMLVFCFASLPKLSFSQVPSSYWYVLVETDFCKDVCYQFVVIGCGDRAAAQEEAALQRASGNHGAHALPEKALIAQMNAGLIAPSKVCTPEIPPIEK